jgi:hypothetical protein
MSPIGTPRCPLFVRFSNRPFRVKRFQTIHHYSVDVAHGLVLLFGIGTRGPSIMGFEDEAEQSFARPCRQTNGRSKRSVTKGLAKTIRAMADGTNRGKPQNAAPRCGARSKRTGKPCRGAAMPNGRCKHTASR